MIFLLGGDYNGCTGTRKYKIDKAVLEPYRLEHTNERGERVLDLARNKGLQVVSTYFTKK